MDIRTFRNYLKGMCNDKHGNEVLYFYNPEGEKLEMNSYEINTNGNFCIYYDPDVTINNFTANKLLNFTKKMQQQFNSFYLY